MTATVTKPARAGGTRVRTMNTPFLRGICCALILVTPFWAAVFAIIVRLTSRG